MLILLQTKISLKLHLFIVYFGSGVITLILLVSLFYIKKQKPEYYKYIFAFILTGFLVSTNTIIYIIWNKMANRNVIFLIEQSLNILQFLSLGYFYIKLFKGYRFERKIKKLVLLAVIIQVMFLILTLHSNHLSISRILATIFLIYFSTIYYRELMNSKPTVILLKSSTFWIVTGIFFSCSINFPIYSISPFLVKYPGYTNVRFQIFAISNITLIILYLLIFKSYLCLKYQQNL
jgi:hypothetical protein